MTLPTHRWALTDRMTEALRRISACRELLDEYLADTEPWHGAIRKQVMASVVHYSTKIEGNRLTREQVEAVIAGEVIEAPEKDKTEAVNYLRAMEWARTRADDPGWHLSHDTLTTLHFLVGQNLGTDYEPLGKYREHQNTVSDRATGQVIYWPPRPEDLRSVLDEFVEWARSLSDADTDPYIANALVHLIFVAIHPFSDGNGRVARTLCSLLMMREGHKAQAFYSLEEYFGVNWEAYGKQIERALGPRWKPAAVDCTPWIEWYLEAIAVQVAQAAHHIARIMAEIGVMALQMYAAGDAISPKTLIALWLARRDGQITNRTYRNAVDVQSKTASQHLQRLVHAGYLTQIGQRRGAHYVLGEKTKDWKFDRLVDIWLDKGRDGVAEEIFGVPAPQSETLFSLGAPADSGFEGEGGI